MSKQTTILREAAQYVHTFLLEYLPPAYVYHNYDHAEEVAEVCGQLAKAAKLSKKERTLVQLAAWFHDCGYAVEGRNVMEGSLFTVRQFLESKAYPEEQLDKVLQLIQNLHSDELPADDLEKILQDANNSFIGRKRFFRRANLLKLEKEMLDGEKVTLNDWNQQLLDRLLHRPFCTLWARERFRNRRNKNILAQRKNIRNAYKKTIRKKTGKDFGRGIDTLYRITLRNHINLSNIADGKANMIISVNTLVLSILITVGAAGITLSPEPNFLDALPILMLMLTALSAIVVAVLSAIPKVSGTEFDEEDLKQRKVSLLFFGNFLRVEKSRFVAHLRFLKKDQELLYDDLSKDLYNLGVVLNKKYRLLKIAYRIFIIGLILSFTVYLITYLI